MRNTLERPAALTLKVVTVKARCRVATTYSRRHIDLQRVATALCPANANAPVRLARAPRNAA
ncbi:hypothetical protein C7C46_01830 [Streptomyces tateyamensis]|uniref:Uncharacterized protein n=1 Tax=Streptomyces tateyamensis TaxID=565073 RepID=A0A2V4NQJ3_9ACTN|nr:putative leader peptide [Streptomyces tateyamensis]PYC88035.1 hypothetical protein C7C46_01830 [Streptomyces tateyamensis]